MGEYTRRQTSYFFLPSSGIKRLEAEESFPREWRKPAWLGVVAKVFVYLPYFRGIPLNVFIPELNN